MGNLSESEKVQTALQRIVDRIDDEFGLYAKFMEIAKLKANHITNGGTEHWPLWDVSREWLSEEEFEREIADATDTRFAFWKRPTPPVRYTCEIDQNGEYVLSEPIATDNDDIQTDWPMSYDSGVRQDSAFFYVPHAPLGVIAYVDLPRRDNSPAKYAQAVQKHLERMRSIDEHTGKPWVALEYSVSDEWDSANCRPHGQIELEPTYSRGTNFAWLVIYPSRDGSRLMPMLYLSHEEGGAYLLPLDVRTLEIFRDAIWLNETEHMSVFDRIKELLGYRPNTPRAIENDFRHTAPWLNHNPFFKIKQQHADDLQLLDVFCQQQWGKNEHLD